MRRGQPLQVAFGSDTTFAPEETNLASLRPGETMEVVVNYDDSGTHAREVRRLGAVFDRVEDNLRSGR